MFESSSIHPTHFGLIVGAEPVRQIKPRSHRRTMTGWFPTRKGTLPSLRTDSLLELGGLAQFEVNPDCVLMATQPHHLVYHEPRADGGTTRRVYTPDAAIQMRDGRVIVVDFKIAEYTRLPYWQALEPILAEAYQRDHGIAFRTITDEMIGIEPRKTNVSIMLMHRCVTEDTEAMVAVQSVLARTPLPTTIGAIKSHVALPSCAHVDRTFSVIMELAIRGEIRLDLGVPLGGSTRIDLPG
jgi:hypothetical protein